MLLAAMMVGVTTEVATVVATLETAATMLEVAATTLEVATTAPAEELGVDATPATDEPVDCGAGAEL